MKINIMKILQITVLLCFISMTASGCGLLPKEEEALAPPLVKPKRTEYELYKAARQDITKTLKGTGLLIAEKEEALYFKESNGRLQSIDVKLSQVVKKGTVLARLETDNLESRIEQQKNEIEKVRIQLQNLKKAYDKYMALPMEFRPSSKEMDDMLTNIKLQEIDLRNAELVLADLNKDLGMSELVAPFDGIVTFVEDLKAGDLVEAYKKVINVADPQRLQIYYQPSESLSNIKIGMKTKITYENQDYQGEVVMSPDNTPEDVLDKYKNALIIQAKDLPTSLELGSSIDFTIDILSKKNVIAIPKKGLKKYVGRSYVQVMEGDSKKEFDVETGIESAYEVEIISGLKEGQMVILN